MSKYIIDVGDAYVRHGLERTLTIPVRINEHEDHWMDTRIPLTPYTEPDMEKIREEAYEDGYKTAKVQCNIQAEKDLREVGERHYQKGLSDAWEAARKIALDKEDGGLDTAAYCETFGYGKSFGAVLKTFTASEAVEKIRQYEQEQQIQVGDEVISPDGKAVVTEISDRNVRIMYSNGSGYVTQLEELTKTGHHFSEISAVLAKMKEES